MRDEWIAGQTVRMSIYFLEILEFLNACISFNIGLINTKLENVANADPVWVSYRLSHGETDSYVPSPSWFETGQ